MASPAKGRLVLEADAAVVGQKPQVSAEIRFLSPIQCRTNVCEADVSNCAQRAISPAPAALVKLKRRDGLRRVHYDRRLLRYRIAFHISSRGRRPGGCGSPRFPLPPAPRQAEIDNRPARRICHQLAIPSIRRPLRR
jgi:hypothetical protein